MSLFEKAVLMFVLLASTYIWFSIFGAIRGKDSGLHFFLAVIFGIAMTLFFYAVFFADPSWVTT